MLYLAWCGCLFGNFERLYERLHHNSITCIIISRHCGGSREWWHLCPGLSTSPLTTMADTRRDDPHASSIAERETSHEMHALPVAAQIAREDLPALPESDPGRRGDSEDGGEAQHDVNIARASTPQQTKGPSDGDDDAKNCNAPQDPPEDHQGVFNAASASTPITTGQGQGQGPPSFAQSEFYTVNFDSFVALIIETTPLNMLSLDCPSSTPRTRRR
jgi:hypothetical protein